MFFSIRVNYHPSECMFLSVRVNYHWSKWIIMVRMQVILVWYELPLVRKHVFVSESKLSLVKMNYHWSVCMFLSVRVNYHRSKWIIAICQNAFFCQLEWIIIRSECMFLSVWISSVSELSLWIIIVQNACFCQLEWIIIGQSELSSLRMSECMFFSVN